MRKFFAFVLVMLCCIGIALGQKIDPVLSADIGRSQNQTELFRILVVMNQQYDQTAISRQTSFMDKATKRDFVVKEKKRFSNMLQADVMSFLTSNGKNNAVRNIKSYWSFNGFSCEATREVIENLSQRSDVRTVCSDKEHNMLPKGEGVMPFDGAKGNSWNVTKVNADDVWTYNGSGYNGNGVVVAVIDTGVNYNHNDIKNNMWDGGSSYPYHGYDFVNGDNDPMDDHGHGTHCAGTVAGDGTSGTQTGMAPGAEIMALKVLNSSGKGYTSNIIDAIEFAVEHGADVISMSLGGSGGGYSGYRDVFVSVLESGIPAAVAAGNDGDDLATYPIPYNISSPGNCPPPYLHPDQANYQSGGTTAVISVGATTQSDEHTYFTSVGPATWTEGNYIGSYYDYPYSSGSSTLIGLIRPDVAAPGYNIPSLDYSNNSGYCNMSGTSMATPCTAGVIALMLEANSELTPAVIDSILEYTAVRCEGATTKSNYTGSGRIDAYAAIEAVLTPSDVPTGLLVSHTGYAKWNAPINGELTGYKIKVNDGSETFITDTHFQHNTADLIDGQTYTTSLAAVISGQTGEWITCTWTYLSCDNFDNDIEELTATPNGMNVTFNWTPGIVKEFEESFEDGLPEGWTTIDADGDGDNWTRASDVMSSCTTHSGVDCMISKSYYHSAGALYPDNYLISKKVNIINGSTFSFWACAQDASYAAEHFGVAVSTSNTSASTFATVSEWTIGSKTAKGNETVRGTRSQTTWTQYTVDLSAYAGQSVFIAIRHFNCTDQFYLDVDDAVLSIGGKGAGTAISSKSVGSLIPESWALYLDDEFIGCVDKSVRSHTMIMTDTNEHEFRVVKVDENYNMSCGEVVTFSISSILYYTVSVIANPSDGGIVTGSGYYAAGSTATLTASPTGSYNFKNWTESGNVVSTNSTYSFTVTGNKTLVANFESGPEQDIVTIGQTYYDWQSNAGARNYTAVWPDGFAAMCWTTSTQTNYSDRGTGIATFDPATGEWTASEGRIEPVKTGFGSIARYKENGLVVAAHTSSDVRFWINEDFRNGSNTWTEVTVPSDGHDPCWPVVGTSGENLDIIHLLYTDNGATSPYKDPLLYSRYVNGTWQTRNENLPALSADRVSAGKSNMAYFIPCDPERPNRIAFIVNGMWTDGKAVVSDDNGSTWNEKVFYQHPDINATYDDMVLYPRWTNASFDASDNLHIVYEYNGFSGSAGNESYYPGMGGIGHWSEALPKNPMCIGGIGNAGQPFIMDAEYINQDLYKSEWYWSDANHDVLPEYIGEMERLDTETHQVVPHDYSGDCFWPGTTSWSAHGSYNGGKAQWASMAYDKNSNTIVAVWSQICGDEETGTYLDGTNYYFRLFYNVSYDGGQTWNGTRHAITDAAYDNIEMSYPVVIPYIYSDSEGNYVWVCAQMDEETGTYVQNDETVYDNNFYKAVKIYIDEAPSISYYVSATANPSDGGTVTGFGYYAAGSTATLTASPTGSYNFKNWTESGNVVSTNSTYSFTVTGNKTLVANFETSSPGGSHWIPDPYQYSENMDVIAQVQIDGVTQNNTMIEVGAFCGDEVRGSSRITYSQMFDKYVLNLKVYGESNDVITFRVYDHQTSTEPGYYIPSTVTFSPNAIIGNNINPYIIECFNSVVQSNSLAVGWNWYSTYIATSGTEGFEMLTTGLGDNAAAVKSQTGISVYYEDYDVWDGSLTTFGNEQMYMIKMSTASTLEISGGLTDLTETPLTLQPGWNWISYPNNNEMPLTGAISGFTPSDGDCFKSQTSVALYYEGYGWDGSLTTLQPGCGYMYKNSTSSAKTLVYSNGGSKDILEANMTADGNHWQPNVYGYQNNMNIIAAVTVDGAELASEDYEVGVFCGDECRGSARLVYKELLGRYIMYLMVYGNDGDNLSFRLYDVQTESEYEGVVNYESLFSSNAVIGDIFNPYIIDFGMDGISENESSAISIYPNPVTVGSTINLGLVCEKVQVINSLGAVIKEYTNTDKIDGIDVAGVYYILLINEKSNSYNKIVVKQ